MSVTIDDAHAGVASHPESLMMGYGYKPELSEGSIKCPIFQTSTFVFKSAEEGKAFFEFAHGVRKPGVGEEAGLIYTRINNPDIEILEDRLTLWDKAEAAAVFASGMGAISTALLTFLRPGDVLVHSEPIYGGTDHLIKAVLPEFGIIPVGFHAMEGTGALERAMEIARSRGPIGMLLIETPANPTNALVDMAACAAYARQYSTPERKILLAVDNTFLGPVFSHPIDFGADLVLYSATKYIGGHSDVIAGVALGTKELISKIKPMRSMLGTSCGAHTGWLLLRSLETLKIRMDRAAESASIVADYLAGHPKVAKVYYLGHLTPEDPQYDIYQRQCLSPGAMISFDTINGQAGSYRFLNALKLIRLAVSLGGTESLAEHPASMTHSDIPPDELARMGVGDALVRLSVGVEHPDDLIADLGQALEMV